MGLFGLFGNKRKKIQEMLEQGAMVIDVRSKDEFNGGHVKGSVNVPVGAISNKIKRIKKLNKPVITCCATGLRSGTAARELKQNNIVAFNGGSWTTVNSIVA